jgi:hypothetical protein
MILLYARPEMKKMKFMMTMVAPVGRSKWSETITPATTEITAENEAAIISVLKLFAIWRAVTAGKMSNAEMSIIPTTFMDRTTVTAVSRTKIVLISFVFMPEAFAESSSKVMERRSW